MAEKEKKFIIEIFRKKEPDELMSALADPNGRLQLGSAAALTAADACAMALRGARIAAAECGEKERMDYIIRNLDHLKTYMVYLIDEDVKGQNILRRAQKEGDPQKVDAARQPACAISDEVINQMVNALELMSETAELKVSSSAIYLASAAEMAMAAIRSARLFVIDMSRRSSDETFAFIVRRENEIRLEQLAPQVNKILSWAEDCLR